ncbi:phosphatase PAP2 family protein [Salibacter sp.]|uniref:phosphatase PAP2 family protein n=1 Tax=Salibacter sp. TaxID=2010995 RepID=UPI002870873F|nr:phosphatase PAP2 family protein [Salibacter sp.]MDR9399195.1 phosphatase PAP2 family protein [Salibacter sp.]MDR9487922.1 phosphatase PAP2 family protein [Salibacter sp.]
MINFSTTKISTEPTVKEQKGIKRLIEVLVLLIFILSPLKNANSQNRTQQSDYQWFITIPIESHRKMWSKKPIIRNESILPVAGFLTLGGLSFTVDKLFRSNSEKNEIWDHVTLAGGPIAQAGVPTLTATVGALTNNDEFTQLGMRGMAAIGLNAFHTYSIKLLVGRRRPKDGIDLEGPNFFEHTSFVSGHTSGAFALATVASMHFDKPWVSIVSYSTASMVGVSRIMIDEHWFSDVVWGAAIGYMSGRMTVNAFENKRIKLFPCFGEQKGVGLSYRF